MRTARTRNDRQAGSSVHKPKTTRRRTRASSYGVVLLALSVLGGIYAALLAPQSVAQEEQPANQSMQVQEGRDLYLTGCSTCHGLDLQGGAGGPSLIGVGASAVIFQVERLRPLRGHLVPVHHRDEASTQAARQTTAGRKISERIGDASIPRPAPSEQVALTWCR